MKYEDGHVIPLMELVLGPHENKAETSSKRYSTKHILRHTRTGTFLLCNSCFVSEDPPNLIKIFAFYCCSL